MPRAPSAVGVKQCKFRKSVHASHRRGSPEPTRPAVARIFTDPEPCVPDLSEPGPRVSAELPCGRRYNPEVSHSGPPSSTADLIASLRQVLAAAEPREAKARRAAELIRHAVGYRWVGIYEVTRTEIGVIGWSGHAGPTHPRFPRDRGLNGAAVASGETIVVQDVRRDRRYLTTFGSTLGECVVPVWAASGERVVGTIDVESEQVNAFTLRDLHLLERCAEELAPLWEEGSEPELDV